MKIPPSSHFSPVDLASHFNARREDLTGDLGRRNEADIWSTGLVGLQPLRGIPFLFGEAGAANVLVLQPGDTSTRVSLPPTTASYFVFVHAVADRTPANPPGFSSVDPATLATVEGLELGDLVSTYTLEYEDGENLEVPVSRRLGIHQKHLSWRAPPFAAVPARGPGVVLTHGESVALSRASTLPYAFSEARARTAVHRRVENLWLYALPNPQPEKQVLSVTLTAATETSLVYALSTTTLTEHPLRMQPRRKLRMRLPEGVNLNKIGELDVEDGQAQIAFDMGTVMSARAVLDYSESEWLSGKHDVQPAVLDREVIVEYSAHPDSVLHVNGGDGQLVSRALRTMHSEESQSETSLGALVIEPSFRPVKLEIVEKLTGQRVAARLHVHGPHGEYLPPKGHHRKITTGYFEDYAGEFANGQNAYAYVDGSCVVDLPIGRVFIEVTRGFEVQPLRRIVEIDASTEVVKLELKRVLRWREQGWITSDTHVHFLSPQTALLEGKAEDVNVVNLLASQWGELFTNVADYDGRTTLGAKDFGGDGAFLVRVGTENRMEVLGHISLLGYEGEMIVPLCVGGPDESAIGDPLEVTMTGWAEACRQQGGVVVLPHGPDRQAERAAAVVLGSVDAIEMMTANPRKLQISAFGLADWYRYLNIGYQVPLVGGSDKMSAAELLGGIRTYVHLGEKDFNYSTWKEAIRQGNTFVTVGPLVSLSVDGTEPGGKISLSRTGGTVNVSWKVESVSVPPERVEVLCNGVVVEQFTCDELCSQGVVALRIKDSSWIAVRVRGSVAQRKDDIAAHTSAVYVEVGDAPIFASTDAVEILRQIEGSLAYLDTIAPRSDEARHARARAALQLAHHRLHHRLHKLGAHHSHAPIHTAHIAREH